MPPRSCRAALYTLLLSATAAVGCASDPAKVAAESGGQIARATLSGRVIDENGAGVAGAQIAAHGGDTVTADASGAYQLTATVPATGPLPLAFAAAGFATAHRALPNVANQSALPDITLRAVDSVTSVTLPTSHDAAAATVSFARGDGAVTLGLPAASLVGPDGALASGAVDVSLTYWHPQSLGPSIPAPLIGIDSDGANLRLNSYGMADIQVSQNGTPLQVAAGATVDLSFTMSAADHNALLGRSPAELPALFYVDPAEGQWVLSNRVGEGNFRYDDGAGVFEAHPTHLSLWNIDGFIRPDSGGCITGRVLNSCTGAPLAAQPVGLYILGAEQLARFQARSNAQGQWCITVGTPSNNEALTFQYLMTGANIEATNQCNPLPRACWQCDPRYQWWPAQESACNTCKNSTYQAQYAGDTIAFYGDNGVCNPPNPGVTIASCNFCAGDAPSSGQCKISDNPEKFVKAAFTCAAADTLLLPGPGCRCTAAGKPCVAGQACCVDKDGKPQICHGGVCAPASSGGKAGEACDDNNGCGPELICGDGVCVAGSGG